MQSPNQSVWRSAKRIVGMVHLLPLPGAPQYRGSMQEILGRATRDAEALVAGGVDGIVIENYGDIPFYPGVVPAATVSALTLAVTEVSRIASVPIGVNVLRNDATAALSIAAATGASFIRVNVHSGAMLTDQGWIEGKAYETVRLRHVLEADVAIYADVMVKHAVAPPGLTIEDAARDAVERGCADALIVSGAATGAATDPAELRRVKAAVPETPVWVGSGVSAETIVQLLDIADGVIVGSAFEEGGRAGEPVVVDRVRRVVDVAKSRHS
jgi:membrane complex biogenesis BtpA family protein